MCVRVHTMEEVAVNRALSEYGPYEVPAVGYGSDVALSAEVIMLV